MDPEFATWNKFENADPLPTLVVAGYSNLPNDFGRGLDDFRDFVSRISIAGKFGAVLPRFDALRGDDAEGTG